MWNNPNSNHILTVSKSIHPHSTCFINGNAILNTVIQWSWLIWSNNLDQCDQLIQISLYYNPHHHYLSHLPSPMRNFRQNVSFFIEILTDRIRGKGENMWFSGPKINFQITRSGRLLLFRAGRCLQSSSPSSMLLPDSCSQPGAPNTSSCFFATVTGCGSRNGFNSVSAFWHSNVSMDQWRTADVEGRRHLCSPTTMTLVVPSVQWLTLGDRAFPVAASWAWNSLPPAIRTVSSFTSFWQQLKTHQFRLSFG